MRKISEIIVHHTWTPRDQDPKKTIASVDRSHSVRLHKSPNKLGLHVAYHYIIDSKGGIHKTRPEDEIGYHASNWEANKRSIGVCLIGNFDKERPTPHQLWALRDLIKKIKATFYIEKVSGHRQYSSKTCPGNNLTDKMLGEAFRPSNIK